MEIPMNNALLTLIKLVLTVLFLPVTWACGVIFYRYVAAFPGSHGEFFLWGMFGFLLIFLFFYQFWVAYEFGQNIVSGLLQFAAPANRFMAKCVPFYLTVILLSYCAVANLLRVNSYDHYFMFFAGFAFVMHILLTAQDLQEQEKAFIKPAYLLMMTMAFILTVFVTVLLFNLVLGEFTLPDFFWSMIDHAGDTYSFIGERMMFGG